MQEHNLVGVVGSEGEKGRILNTEFYYLLDRVRDECGFESVRDVTGRYMDSSRMAWVQVDTTCGPWSSEIGFEGVFRAHIPINYMFVGDDLPAAIKEIVFDLIMKWARSGVDAQRAGKEVLGE